MIMQEFVRGSGGSAGRRSRPDGSKFSLSGNGVYFGPFFMPDRVSVSKERNLVRHANFCGLEDVFEIHGKNREIHIAGKLRQSELPAFERVLDHNQPADLITPSDSFNGEVRVVKGDYEGPVAWEPQTGQWLWEYSLDLVSTGMNEAGHLRYFRDGIVSEGGPRPAPEPTQEQMDLFRGR